MDLLDEILILSNCEPINESLDGHKVIDINGVKFDNKNGVGECSILLDLGYKSFLCYMTPEDFLQLTPKPYDSISDKELLELANVMKQQGVAMPFLEVTVNMLKDELQIWSHEGRHRCLAMIKYLNMSNQKIPVVIQGSDYHPIPTDIKGWQLRKQDDPYGYAIELNDIEFDLARYKFKNFTSSDMKARTILMNAPTEVQAICQNNASLVKYISDLLYENGQLSAEDVYFKLMNYVKYNEADVIMDYLKAILNIV